MSNIARMMQRATAGAAGGATTDVDDVFSTYLYTGNNDDGKSRGINNGIALGNFGTGSSTDFDGTASPLRRTSALSGLSDGKQFTFSFWINFDEGDVNSFAAISFNTFYFTVYGNENQLQFVCRNSSNTNILYAEINETNPRLFSQGIWYHILVSIDLTNSSNRYIYINDVSKASSTTWNTYTNDNIDFTQSTIDIADFTGQSASYSEPCKLAHMYLDTTYRDLSTTSNRRIFIDANGGSTSASSLSALNPVLYLPLTNDYAITKNLGTGGDFTSSGAPKIDTTIGTEYDSTAGQGGLTWIKSRNTVDTSANYLYDTERGVGKVLHSNGSGGEYTAANYLTSFNATGFTLGNQDANNSDADNFVSWTFRKAPKFFDIVTYTGDDSGNVVKSHSLGSTPGMIIIKNLSSNTGWDVFHRSTTNGLGTGRLFLHDTSAEDNTSIQFLTADSSSITLTHTIVKTGGENYVAYLFAHNNSDGGFGPDSDQDIIKCGSYTGNGSSTGPVVNLGFEPQWIIVKGASQSSNWTIIDSMRGIAKGANAELFANLTNSEGTVNYFDPQATGFQLTQATYYPNSSAETYIYMAIRRGPLAEPEDATKVFHVNGYSNNSNSNIYNAGFNVDMNINTKRASYTNYIIARLTGGDALQTNLTNAAIDYSSAVKWFNNKSNHIDLSTGWFTTHTDLINYSWRRAPSYFDVVAYTGTGSNRTVSHNLGVVPEMMWIKCRSNTDNWVVFHKDVGATKILQLNNDIAQTTTSTRFNDTAPTSSVFTVSTDAEVNGSGRTYIAYLFATVAGVSKVGSYTGNSTDGKQIDCGFSSGARFVLIKNTTVSNTNWLFFDTVRGIVTGNDPVLELNSTDAEVTGTDYVDPYSSGFELTANAQVNYSGSTYIFYAVA